ncbi:DUF5060 domain-containing protein [Polaribacter sp. M15]
MRSKSIFKIILLGVFIKCSVLSHQAQTKTNKVFEEKNGFLKVEAEDFYKQTKSGVRKWYVITPEFKNKLQDPDPTHAATASNKKYIELLPDTRVTHKDKLTNGVNFTGDAGKIGVLHYKVKINTPGRYYIWVKAFSTGSEDNGIHVGLDGNWPQSGKRMQWCEGKRQWFWESKQRTKEVHCGVAGLIYLDIDKAGEHEIQFSMREDGFEMDQWLMTNDKNYNPRGKKKSKNKNKVSTINQTKKAYPKATILKATDFNFKNTGFYKNNEWLAINPNKNKNATASLKYAGASGLFDVVLLGVGENDGQSRFTLKVNNHQQGNFRLPLSIEPFEEGAQYAKSFSDVQINNGDEISIQGFVASADGKEYSRGRWRALIILPIGQGENLIESFKAETAKNVEVKISKELKKWHKITLTFDGPETSEKATYNPFVNYRFNTTFIHKASGKKYVVPGFFAADGKAGQTGADKGNKWKVNFTPDEIGEWTYKVDFRKGRWVAVSTKKKSGVSAGFMDGATGSFTVKPTDKTGRDFRSKGRLNYVGKRYLQFAETGEYFLKQGPDAPENFLSFVDFDGTFHNDGHKDNLVKKWEAHVQDWKKGNPTWRDGKGKAIIGAINYLASKDLNVVSFLTNNIKGDDQNVFPYVDYDTYDRIDVSKTDQWEIVFAHAQKNGLFLHFKTLEMENQGLLDNGGVGFNSKLYYRELIARFGHHLALNWNLGEENGEWVKNHPTPPQETAQRLAMAQYFKDNDPYNHHIVIHNGIQYNDVLGKESAITGPSIQTHHADFRMVHKDVLKWLKLSKEAGKQWAVAVDEPGDAQHSLMPDADDPDHDLARKNALWATFMAGGWGNEWYFGYKHAHSDLTCEDYRSRDLFWNQAAIAKNFFLDHKIPFWEMENRNDLVGNSENKSTAYCLAKENEIYVVYLNSVETINLDLSEAKGNFTVFWFNPKKGGDLQKSKVKKVRGGSTVALGESPDKTQKDWVVLVVRK